MCLSLALSFFGKRGKARKRQDGYLKRRTETNKWVAQFPARKDNLIRKRLFFFASSSTLGVCICTVLLYRLSLGAYP